jgi:CDP-paratose 2-epimerase
MYVLDTNLNGTINCLETCRQHGSAIIFLSTSRVYPIKVLNQISLFETKTRFEIDEKNIYGVSKEGITENLTLNGFRSLYGSTKLASELLITEYNCIYGLKSIINRCGVLTGPWQMGKVDQGFIVLWIAQHLFNGKLSYNGYGSMGKQVRDILHVNDLFKLLMIQISDLNLYNGNIYNVGGGLKNSISLLEMTSLCENITGNKITVEKKFETNMSDIPLYISDNSKINSISGWMPSITISEIIEDVYSWLFKNQELLKSILK